MKRFGSLIHQTHFQLGMKEFFWTPCVDCMSNPLPCANPLPFLNRLISIVNDSMTHDIRRFGHEDEKQQGIFLTPTALRSHHMEASFCLTHQKSTFQLRDSVGK